MLHPLLNLIATRPNLLADHAEAYAELLGEEIGVASAQWKRRMLLSSMALCSLGVGAVLTGVALMLWAVIPPQDMNAPWALVVAPLVPLLGAVVAWLGARGDGKAKPFDQIRRQLHEDAVMLREASAS